MESGSVQGQRAGRFEILYTIVQVNSQMKLINIIYASLRKPVSVVVALIAIIFFSILSITKMPVDIFPKVGTPTIYVAQTYGGLSPEQMEGFISSYYEYHFL